MKYKAMYKCDMCGDVFSFGNAVDLEYDKLPSILGKFVKFQEFAGNPYLYNTPMYLPHKCSDGSSGGLAHFIGFRELSTIEQKESNYKSILNSINKLLNKGEK